MNSGVLVFTRDQNLLFELGHELEDKHPIVPCESLDHLPERLKTQPIGAVLVHLDRTTLNGYSPARFIAELDEAIENAPMYGLMTTDCPPRLKKLAEKTVDDCLDFPLDYGRLRRLLSEEQDLDAELAGFWNQMPHKELHGRSRSLVTFTPEMFDMMDEIKVAARHNVTVLLIGETGSGKTFLARLIHELSDRRDDRLCTVACGALPPDLIESELFGYVKGAFTGADRDREGKFAAAGRGTLLLDEIDVLPLEQQAKLLRVIETGEYEPVGSNETQYSQARLIVASQLQPGRAGPGRQLPHRPLLPAQHSELPAAAPCGSGRGTSNIWPANSPWSTAARTVFRSARSNRHFSRRCGPITGRATSARWKTSSAGPCSIATAAC